MAFELESDISLPEVTVVESYQVHRLGLHPTITVQLTECVRMLEPVVEITEVISDTEFKIEAWFGRGDLVGKELVTPSRQVIGSIVSVDEEMITLDTEHPELEVGDKLSTQAINVVGVPTWERVPRGQTRTLRIFAGRPEGQQLLSELMVKAHVRLGMGLVHAMELPISQEEVVQAVLGLISNGKSIDDALTIEAEEVEKNRRSGDYPFLGQ